MYDPGYSDDLEVLVFKCVELASEEATVEPEEAIEADEEASAETEEASS